jgi:hypothetical protein
MPMLRTVDEVLPLAIRLETPTGEKHKFGPVVGRLCELTGNSVMDLYSKDGNSLGVPFWTYPIIDIKAIRSVTRSGVEMVVHVETPPDWPFTRELASCTMKFTFRGNPRQMDFIANEISERIAAFGNDYGLRSSDVR